MNFHELEKLVEEFSIKEGIKVKKDSKEDEYDTRVKTAEAYGYNDVIWENQFLKIIYVGVQIEKSALGKKYWKLVFIVKPKVKVKFTVNVENCIMNDCILRASGTMLINYSEHFRETEYVEVSNEEILAIGIRNMNEVKKFEIKFVCYNEKGKTIARSPIIYLQLFSRFEKIENEIKNLVKIINSGRVWNIDSITKPKLFRAEVQFPNGKDGDIDYNLVLSYNPDQTTNPLVHVVNIPTEKIQIIDLIFVFYCIRESMPRCFLEKRNNEVWKFIRENNNIIKLKKYYDLMKMNVDVSSDIMIQAKNIINNKYEDLKEKRNLVYSDLVLKGTTSSKWKTEQQIFKLVESKYKEAIFQYRPIWLGQQSLDVFIPSIKTAIEYQGRQHYESVDFFGGEEHFIMQKERDLRKKVLCHKNGVLLIEWPYTLEPSGKNLELLLKGVI